jgi:hypothetical protein
MRLLGVVESDTGRQTEASSESICICMEMSCLKSMVQIDSCKRQDPIGVASHTRTDSFCWVLGRKGQSPKPPRGKMASYYPLPAVVPVPACLPTDTTAQLHKTFPYITTSSDVGFRAQRTSIPDLTKHPQAKLQFILHTHPHHRSMFHWQTMREIPALSCTRQCRVDGHWSFNYRRRWRDVRSRRTYTRHGRRTDALKYCWRNMSNRNSSSICTLPTCVTS